jgi:hypothetical protein
MNITKKNVSLFAKSESISSYDFWKVLNQIRKDEGASEIQHGDFIKRVEDECDFFNSESFVVKNTRGNRELKAYMLNHDQMILVGMRESKAVRKQVLNWLKDLTQKVCELKNQIHQRNEASLNFKEQSAALKLSREMEGKETLSHHYANEADLLNIVILGCSAKNYRIKHNLDDKDSLRDTLTPVELEAFISLRKANENYLLDGMSYIDRKTKLLSRFIRFFNKKLVDELHRLG